MIKSGTTSLMGDSTKSNSDYRALDHLPQIEGNTLMGDLSLDTLGIAPAGYGDDSVWSIEVSKSTTATLDSITINSKTKAGVVINTYTITLPNDYYKDVVFNETTLVFTLTRKDGTTTDVSLANVLDRYVLKTTTIAGIDLQDNITSRELEDTIKDQTTALTNKTIDADNNTISNLDTTNFKASAIATAITDNPVDTKLATEKAVKDYADTFAKTGSFTKPTGTTGTLNVNIKDNKGADIVDDNVENVVFTNDTQTLTNKTINNENNTIQQKSSLEADIVLSSLADKEFIYATDTNKLYIKSGSDLKCINWDYTIKEVGSSDAPTTIAQNNETSTLNYSVNQSGVGLVDVKYPAVFINYTDYQALPPDKKQADIVYVIPDYPSADITETREMVNNRWVITRTPSTLPLLTFLYHNVVHNYHVYYTKEETNTLLDYKEDIINGGASTIAHDNLSANKILVSDDTGKVVASSYPTETLESIGLVFSPTYTISSIAQQYITNVNINGYVLNKSANRYQLDISMDVLNQVATWRSGGLMTITMPNDFTLNYNANKPTGFYCAATRFNSTSDWDYADVLMRYLTNTQIQVYMPQCELFTSLGRITMSITLF